MLIHIDSHASLSNKGEAALTKAARDSVKSFFKECEDPGEIVLHLFACVRGGDPQRLIKFAPAFTLGHSDQGVPVIVSTGGTQGVNCRLRIVGQRQDQVRLLIEQGPYLRKKKAEKPPELVIAPPVAEPAQGTGDATLAYGEVFQQVVTVAPPESAEAKEETATGPQAPRLTPLERLKRNGVDDGDIERLKATMASIVYRTVGEGEIPNLVQVPVTEITKAILEHMKLPYNAEGNYRGTIGNFYATRVSLFALKYESSLEPGAQYTDWLVDCILVLDFVGGRNQLAALTRDRDEEVRQRLSEEESARANPPPTAITVEEVANGGFVADAVLLDMALRSLEGKRKTEEELRLAKANAEDFGDKIARLELQLEEARTGQQSALALVADVEARLKQYVLTPEALASIRAAKVRLDTLVEGLGI